MQQVRARAKRANPPRPGLEPEWGRAADCAVISGFSEPHLWRAIRAGCFETVKTGDAHNAPRLINLASFRAWVRGGARIPRAA
jgi:hypothetical protein